MKIVPIGSKAASREARGPLYVDTSALLKLYFREPESNLSNAILRGRSDVMISHLAVTEMVSALARRCREGTLPFDVAAKARRAVLDHIETGIFRCVDLLPESHREAEDLLLETKAVALRAADALHLALARGARANGIVTFDRRMAEAGRIAGFVTLPR